MDPACRLCGAPTRAASYLTPLPFRECATCGFVFRADRAPEHVRDEYEGGAYAQVRATHYAMEETLPDRRRSAGVLLDFVGGYAPPARLLDVGAAGGAFVEQARARGFRAEGLEPTPEFVAFARERVGIELQPATIEDAQVAPASFDVVTMWHVLEHVPEPVEVLGLVREALAPGGIVALEVPNAGGHAARRSGTRWGSLEPDVHVNQFGAHSLRLALEVAGFEILSVGSVTITEYLTFSERLRPGHLAHRAKSGLALRSVRAGHPTGHELLRAVARRHG